MKNEAAVQLRNVLILGVALVGCSANRSPDPPSHGTIITNASSKHDAGAGGSAGQGAVRDAGTSTTSTGGGQPGLGSGGSLSLPDAGGGTDDGNVGPADAAVTDAAVDVGSDGEEEEEEEGD